MIKNVKKHDRSMRISAAANQLDFTAVASCPVSVSFCRTPAINHLKQGAPTFRLGNGRSHFGFFIVTNALKQFTRRREFSTCQFTPQKHVFVILFQRNFEGTSPGPGRITNDRSVRIFSFDFLLRRGKPRMIPSAGTVFYYNLHRCH